LYFTDDIFLSEGRLGIAWQPTVKFFFPRSKFSAGLRHKRIFAVLCSNLSFDFRDVLHSTSECCGEM
jgi:hypothetical protein